MFLLLEALGVFVPGVLQIFRLRACVCGGEGASRAPGLLTRAGC